MSHLHKSQIYPSVFTKNQNFPVCLELISLHRIQQTSLCLEKQENEIKQKRERETR